MKFPSHRTQVIGILLVAMWLPFLLKACAQPEDPDKKLLVERYSERLFTYIMNGRTYQVPENYLDTDSWGFADNAKPHYPKYIRFTMFHPDFGGFSREYAKALGQVRTAYPRWASAELEEKHLKNTIMVRVIWPMTNAELQEAQKWYSSDEYRGFILSQEESAWRVWKTPREIKEYGLRCLSPPTNPKYRECEGKTLKDEQIYMKCDGIWRSGEYNACRVERESVQEGYSVSYEFSENLLPYWKEIDAAVFAKMNSFEKK